MRILANLDWIWRNDKSYALRYCLLFVGGVFIHTVLAIMFGVYGRTELIWSNAAAVLLYVIWGVLFCKSMVTDYLVYFPYADILLHSCAYNVLLGADCSFYLYVFAIMPLMFSFTARDGRRKNPFVLAGLLSLAGIVLMLLTLSVTPRAPIASRVEVMSIFQINLLLSFTIVCAFMWEYLADTKHTQSHLSHAAEYDQLTGLRNRYSLKKETDMIRGTQYCVIMSDVDDFKQINDNYGHAMGDQLLMSIGKTLKECLRKDDIVCRWGGEEFLIVVRADLETARSIAERIRHKVGAITLNEKGARISATMTFGIADCIEGDGFDSVTSTADANLLRGKEAGKNCVVSSTDMLDNYSGADRKLDTSSLSGAIFAAFAATSDTTYIYICDLSTNISRWSKTAVDYFGLPGEYMYDAGSIWLGYIHPEDRHIYEDDINAVFSGKKNTHEAVYRARNKDGEYVVCSCKGVVTEGNGTYPSMFAGTMTNLGVADSNFGKGRHHGV